MQKRLSSLGEKLMFCVDLAKNLSLRRPPSRSVVSNLEFGALIS